MTATDEQGSGPSGKPADQRPLANLVLGKKIGMGQPAEDDDVEPGDMVAHQECRRLRTISRDGDLYAEDIGQAVVPPGGHIWVSSHLTSGLAAHDDRRQKHSEQHMKHELQPAPKYPDRRHSVAFVPAILKKPIIERIACRKISPQPGAGAAG